MNTYTKRRLAGLCGGCGKVPPSPNRTVCEVCRQSGNERASKFRRSRSKNGLCNCGVPLTTGTTRCEKCKKKHAQWIKTKTPEYRRNVFLKSRYGITNEDYQTLLINQDFKCKICSKTLSGSSRSSHLFVDHNHKTGEIRGLLCNSCNIFVGFLENPPIPLEKYFKYLQD